MDAISHNATTENDLRLFETGNYIILAVYALASVILGFLAVFGGNILSKTVIQ